MDVQPSEPGMPTWEAAAATAAQPDARATLINTAAQPVERAGASLPSRSLTTTEKTLIEDACATSAGVQHKALLAAVSADEAAPLQHVQQQGSPKRTSNTQCTSASASLPLHHALSGLPSRELKSSGEEETLPQCQQEAAEAVTREYKVLSNSTAGRVPDHDDSSINSLCADGTAGLPHAAAEQQAQSEGEQTAAQNSLSGAGLSAASSGRGVSVTVRLMNTDTDAATLHDSAAPQQAEGESKQDGADGSPLRAGAVTVSACKDVGATVKSLSADSTALSQSEDAGAVSRHQQQTACGRDCAQHSGSLQARAEQDVEDASSEDSGSASWEGAAEKEMPVTEAQLAAFRADVAANTAWGKLQALSEDDVRAASQVLLPNGTINIPEWIAIP